MKKWIVLLILIPSVIAAPNVYEFGEDYWFEDNHTIKSSTGTVYVIDEMMDYTVEGEVMGIRFYKEEKAPFGLVDLALVWGDLLKPEVKKDLNVWMEYRYCSYQYISKNSNISLYYLRTHISNNHLIPASQEIFDDILTIQEGDHLRISGALVHITGERQMENKIERIEWGPSSTTLEDEGERACEIILVKSLTFGTAKSPPPESSPVIEKPFEAFEDYYMNVWKYVIGLILLIVLILYIPSKLLSRRQRHEEERSPEDYRKVAKMMEYYNKKGYRTLRYTFSGGLLKIALKKNNQVYLATVNLNTGKIRYRLIE